MSQPQPPHSYPSPLFSTMALEGFKLGVHLGVSLAERSLTQDIRICLTIRYSVLPSGCKTDRIEDTDCYAKICQGVKQFLSTREFALLEKMTLEIFLFLKTQFSTDVHLLLSVTKLKPPMPEVLEGGVSFTLSEWARP